MSLRLPAVIFLTQEETHLQEASIQSETKQGAQEGDKAFMILFKPLDQTVPETVTWLWVNKFPFCCSLFNLGFCNLELKRIQPFSNRAMRGALSLWRGRLCQLIPPGTSLLPCALTVFQLQPVERSSPNLTSAIMHIFQAQI